MSPTSYQTALPRNQEVIIDMVWIQIKPTWVDSWLADCFFSWFFMTC